ncbi:hypothetical protein TNCV_3865791 [Trichonephila clavipes]|nr:hypothetical protein TNCV_3865791 [Trichonephila clavipes]
MSLKLFLCGSDCKDLLPEPGNRSNETHNIEWKIWQRHRGEKGLNEERTGERWREKRGRIKERLRDDARDLDESPDLSMSKIVLRDLIISSKYYKEEEAKELLEVITAERLENSSKN